MEARDLEHAVQDGIIEPGLSEAQNSREREKYFKLLVSSERLSILLLWSKPLPKRCSVSVCIVHASVTSTLACFPHLHVCLHLSAEDSSCSTHYDAQKPVEQRIRSNVWWHKLSNIQQIFCAVCESIWFKYSKAKKEKQNEHYRAPNQCHRLRHHLGSRLTGALVCIPLGLGAGRPLEDSWRTWVDEDWRTLPATMLDLLL